MGIRGLFLFVITALAGLGSWQSASAQAFTNYQFTTIDVPQGAEGTLINGISGNFLVGIYADSSGVQHGFVYDGTSFFAVDDPDGTGTEPYGVTGNVMVGAYTSTSGLGGAAGFIYANTNGGTYTKVQFPNQNTKLAAIGDGLAVGAYGSGLGVHGFIYNGTTFATLDYPNASGTVATGISSGRVVGAYVDSSGFSHGYLYDGTNFATIDDPLASAANGGTEAIGISGNNITGIYFDTNAKPHGFIYNGTTYTTFDHPLGVNGTELGAIDGVNVCGYYIDAQGKDHGFVAMPMQQAFNAWQTNHGIGSPLANSAVLYGDGVPLLMKYLAGIDPSRPMTAADRAALPHLVAAQVQGVPNLQLRFRRSGTASQAQVQLQTSADLVTWTNDLADVPDNIFNDTVTGDPIMEVQVPVTSTVKFVRLQVTGP